MSAPVTTNGYSSNTITVVQRPVGATDEAPTAAAGGRRGFFRGRKLDLDLWVRRGCAAVVALVAAYGSFAHQRHFALLGGADSITALLWPLSVDGLVVLASLGMLKMGPGATRRARWTVRLSFWGGVIVSLVANIAAAPALAWRPILVAGWPPLALLAAVELLTHRTRPQAKNETSQTPRQNETTGETSPARPERGTDTEPAERARPSRSKGETASPAQDDEIVTLAAADRSRRASAKQSAETVMWEYYQAEQAQGRTPTGAELDRVAGTNNYGRTVLARWRRTGRIPSAAAPRPVSRSTMTTATSMDSDRASQPVTPEGE